MITFSDGSHMAFSDMRKFATIFCIEESTEYQRIIDSYGPEPLTPRLSFDVFMSRLKTRPQMMVKPALLDQSLISGFGNIYSDEVLWSARVHPESRVSAIPEQQWRDIFHYGKKILRSATAHGGDSDGDYRRVDGTGGTYHNMHRVYRRDGQDCFNQCGFQIEKKQIGQRIGRYCPHCQILYTNN